MPEVLEQPNVSESKRFHAEDFENSPEPMEVASLGSGLKLTKRGCCDRVLVGRQGRRWLRRQA